MLSACSSSFLYSIVEFVVGNYQLQFYLNILFCRNIEEKQEICEFFD